MYAEKAHMLQGVFLTISPFSRDADACGFEDEFYFSRCFRRQFGSPPRTYRKEHLIRSGRAH
jgi:AraC-like DNA-binding protein